MLRYYLAAVVLCYAVSLPAIALLWLLGVEFTLPVLNAISLVLVGIAAVIAVKGMIDGRGIEDERGKVRG